MHQIAGRLRWGNRDHGPRKTARARVRTLGGCAALLLALSTTGAQAEQTLFPTPEEGLKALIEAAASEEPGALIDVLGTAAEELGSGDQVADAAERRSFVEAATQSARIEIEGDDHATVQIGAEAWPFPIPLVRTDAGWHFDVDAGLEELLNRRIGRNELHVIEVARAYVEAQYEYASADRDGDGQREFAQRIKSSEGSRDGLYWPAAEGEPESPLGPLVAEAVTEGYSAETSPEPQPYHGYLYRILTRQGEAARGGARDWTVDGNLTSGFGLLAYPAEYGGSGIMTFLVDRSGIVLERDLGAETPELAPAIDSFDPGPGWEVVTD